MTPKFKLSLTPIYHRFPLCEFNSSYLNGNWGRRLMCDLKKHGSDIYQENPINKVLPPRTLSKQIYKDTATARLKTQGSPNQLYLHTTEHELAQGALCLDIYQLSTLD